MVVEIVRFKSSLPEEEIQRLYEARAAQYRAIGGLLQKYYLAFPSTGEHGAVYVWESPEALSRFRESDLARTIPETYRIEGSPQTETASVLTTLRPSAGPAPH